MEKASAEHTVELPSADAAWHFSADANESGWKTRFEGANVVRLTSSGPLAAIALGPIVGGTILGLVGWLSEAGTIPLPRLEPLLASPHGAVTMLFAALGTSLGLLLTFFAVVKPIPSGEPAKTAQVIASGKGDLEELQGLAERYGGRLAGGARRPESPTGTEPADLTVHSDDDHLDEDPQEYQRGLSQDEPQ